MDQLSVSIPITLHHRSWCPQSSIPSELNDKQYVLQCKEQISPKHTISNILNLSSVNLTPPYSPYHQACVCAASIVSKFKLSPSPKPVESLPPPCCQLHADTLKADAYRDSESSIITDECIGANSYFESVHIPNWAVGMTSRELEIRLHIAEIHDMYRQKQRLLSKIKKQERSARKAKKKQMIRDRNKQNNHIKRNAKVNGEEDAVSDNTSKLEDISSVDGELDTTAEYIQRNEEKARYDASANGYNTTCAVAEKGVSNVDHDSGHVSLLMDQSLEVEEPESPVTYPNACPRLLAPRLTCADLSAGLRVLLLDGGLLYPGTLSVLDNEAMIYGLLVDGQRLNHPHILCQEEIIKTAFREVYCTRNNVVLSEGTRVCAYWSGQINALYPGTVEEFDEDYWCNRLIPINFDDGDSGKIKLEDIRLLPQDFPITKVQSSVLPAFIQRKRRCRDETNFDPASRFSAGADDHWPPKKQKREHTTPPPAPKSVWQWASPPKPSGKKKRKEYDAARLGPVVLKIGDLVHLRTDTVRDGRLSPNMAPYVGIVQSLWETHGKGHKVRVAWCYKAFEIPNVDNIPCMQRAVFISTHCDDNCLETVNSVCNLVPWTEFHKRGEHKMKDGKVNSVCTYYEAGTYDTLNKVVSYSLDVLQYINTHK